MHRQIVSEIENVFPLPIFKLLMQNVQNVFRFEMKTFKRDAIRYFVNEIGFFTSNRQSFRMEDQEDFVTILLMKIHDFWRFSDIISCKTSIELTIVVEQSVMDVFLSYVEALDRNLSKCSAKQKSSFKISDMTQNANFLSYCIRSLITSELNEVFAFVQQLL